MVKCSFMSVCGNVRANRLPATGAAMQVNAKCQCGRSFLEGGG